jgi:hypothetical protein
MGISPRFHIFAAYFIYILIAVLTSNLVSKIAGDLKDFKVCNSPRVLLMDAYCHEITITVWSKASPIYFDYCATPTTRRIKARNTQHQLEQNGIKRFVRVGGMIAI